MKKNVRATLLMLAPICLVPVIALAAASEVWMDHCARCHGADGTANTKIGKKLKLKDYSNPAVQARMTDDEIYNAIRDGVFDEKGKERMKAYKDTLTEEQMRALVAEVRAFKK